MDGWKAKAQAAKDSAMSSLSEANKKRSTPATKYSPNRFDPAAPPPPTFSELSKTSSVLRQQEEHLHRRPPPPPKRAGLGGESSYIEPNDTPSYTPALPGRSSGPSQSSTVAPGGMGGFKPISQYDDNDKLAFFELMDEFFSTRIDLRESLSRSSPSVSSATRPATKRREATTAAYSPLSCNPSSLALLQYLLYEEFTSTWYAGPSTPTPPIIATASSANQWQSMHMTKSTGNERSLESFFMAGDGSCVWSKLSWNLADEKRGDASSVKREGRYRVPTVWEGDELYAASEVYGPLLVDFAERALAGGVPIGSGECWDLASLALKEIKETRSDLPEPFPSISFFHGHLIYYAKVGGMKVWKGGDSYVRPGDIVQWKEAQVGDLNVAGKSYSLGAPDHTAVIISAAPPTSIPSDGTAFPTEHLVSLVVIEQSPGVVPFETSLDMTKMTKGEIWIFRPVGLLEFVGQKMEVVWPPGIDTLTL